MVNMSKPLLEFLENGDNTYKLTREDYELINIRLINIIKTFPNGELKVEKKYYPLELCTKKDFDRNDFDRAYWDFVEGSRD